MILKGPDFLFLPVGRIPSPAGEAVSGRTAGKV